jgi:glutamyl-tRNA synthetase
VSKDRHPLTGKDFDVYPLMNFSVTIDDHLLGLTHVLRGKDHIMNTERQRFIYEYLGWTPPEIIHHGLLDIVGVELSKSVIKKEIADGKYTGWDDPRLGTLKAIKKRGIEPDAIRSIMKMIGIGEVDSTFDWKNLYAENRKIIEPKANRYFFVPDPEEMWVSGMPKEPIVIRVPLHLDHPERGYRDIKLKIEKDATRIFIAKKDADKLRKGDEIRLKNFCNLKIDEHEPLKASYIEAKNLKVPIIQWLPKEVLGCEVLGPEGKVAGFCEMACKELTPGTILQFERFGFCKIASIEGNDVICYYTHD